MQSTDVKTQIVGSIKAMVAEVFSFVCHWQNFSLTLAVARVPTYRLIELIMMATM